MKIHMAGIRNADISVREKFSLTKDELLRVLRQYKSVAGVGGVVIISTCNRTEVYVSLDETAPDINIAGILCGALSRSYEEYKSYFFEKKEEPLRHLCLVGAGFQSSILGDDQIITQVREALEYSREHGVADSYLETFFRTAIGAAKEIKTKVILSEAKASSAPQKAVERLRAIGGLGGKHAVVIGNGRMGRLAAELLIREGAEVTVTLREYKKGVIQVPEGANTTPYSRRYESIEKADIALSATTSPHYTIHYEDCLRLKKLPGIMADLAVPRDIEPAIASLTEILTIDDLGDREDWLSPEKLELAEGIIGRHALRYHKWLAYKRKGGEL